MDFDIETIDRQLRSATPRPAVVVETLRSMRTVLEGIAAGLVANGLTTQADKALHWLQVIAAGMLS